MELLYRLLYQGFRLTVLILPEPLLILKVKVWARLFYWFDIPHRKFIYTNLDFAYGDTMPKREKRRIAGRVYQTLLFNLVNFVKTLNVTPETLERMVRFKNDEAFQAAVDAGEPIVLITGHYGNWELVQLAISAKYRPMTSVGRPLDSAYLDRVVMRHRHQVGNRVLKQEGAIRVLMKVLQNGGLAGLIVDQNTSRKVGITTEFFGKSAVHHTSAAMLARRFNARIFPVFMTTTDFKTYEAVFMDPVITPRTDNADADIARSVQAQADATELAIRLKPDEWF